MSDAAKTVELAPDSPLGNQLRVMATDRAAATALPGPLAVAFGREAIVVGPHRVRKVVAMDYRIWDILDSVIKKSMLELEKEESLREAVPVTSEEEWEICYQFLNDCRTVKAKLDEGKEAFRKAAEDFVAYDPTIQVKLVMAAVNQQIANHFATMLQHASEMKESGDVRFFQVGAEAPKTA